MERLLKDSLEVSNLHSQPKTKLTPTHCRFCAKQFAYGELIDLTQVETLEEFNNMMEFLKIDYIDFTNSTLPKTTCEACYNAFHGAYNFLLLTKESQPILNRLYCEKLEVAVSTSKSQVETNNSLSSIKMYEVPIEINNHEDMMICEKTETRSTSDEEDVSNINDLNDSTADDCIAVALGSVKTELTESEFALGTPYCKNVSGFIKKKARSNNDIESWADYPWNCFHCDAKFDNMTDLREHSKVLHGYCDAFKCIDCNDKYNTFNSFIEHVRQHRVKLSNYCQYCNLKSDKVLECIEHALTHWEGGQKICNLCGEIFPDAESLDLHRKLYYKRVRLRTRDRVPKVVAPAKMYYNGIAVTSTWKEYNWTCQDCLVRMPDIATLREHIREYHNKCFAMKCVDCLKVNWNYPDFVSHVATHRLYLQHYCPYCNQYFDQVIDVERHIKDHFIGDQKPCDGCGEIFETKELRKQHVILYKPQLHKGSRATEDMTCDICSKQFETLNALNKHIQIHKERPRPFGCEICGKTFYDRRTLTQHVDVVHTTAAVDKCEFCEMVFKNRKTLKSHVEKHLNKRTFTCNECGIGFNNKSNLRSHIMTHTGIKNFKCTICHKQYSTSSILKIHMYTHDIDSSPYECKQCHRKFSNWPNCNKHMIRIHGVTLAKTKRTAWGTVAINKATGKAKKVVVDNETRKWMEDIVNSKEEKKRGKTNQNKEITIKIE